MRGGIYHILTKQSPSSFDSQKGITGGDTTGPGLQYYGFMMWEDGILTGDLVEDWDVSGDATAYTFQFRDGVTWHDGVPFTAEDARFSIQRLLTPPEGVVFPKARTVLPKIVDSVDVIDPLTVRIKLKLASPLLLEALAYTSTTVMPKHILEGTAQGEITSPEDTIGTGPWRFKGYVRDGQWEVERNPEYFVTGLPYMDGILNVVVPDEGTAWAAFRTKRVDRTVDDLKPPLGEGRVFAEKSGGEANFALNSRHWQTQLYVNFDREPWGDLRVRQAINLVLDRQKFIDLYWEGSGFLPSYIDPRYQWATYSQEELATLPGLRQPKDADIAEAKRLMEEAGLANGIDTVITARSGAGYPDMAVLVAEDLSKIGIRATVKVVAGAAGYKLYQAGEFELAQQNNGLSLTDPSEIFANMFVTGAPRNYGRWDLGPRWHELFDLQMSELDALKRKALLREMEEIMWEQLPVINEPRASVWTLWWGYLEGADDLGRQDRGTARFAAGRGETLWLNDR